jgi:hypothetical protein
LRKKAYGWQSTIDNPKTLPISMARQGGEIMKAIYYRVVRKENKEDKGPLFMEESWAKEYIDKFLNWEVYEIKPIEVDIK